MKRPIQTSIHLALVLVLDLAACGGGDENGTPTPPGGGGSGGDGGTQVGGDAGIDMDGAVRESGTPMDGSRPDSGEADSAADASTEPDEPRTFEIAAEDRFEFDVSDDDRFWDEHGYGVAVSGGDFAIAYQDHDPGEDCANRIDVVRIPSYGEAGKPKTVVNTDIHQCTVATEPALLFVDEKLQLFWSDNRDGVSGIYQMEVDSEKDPVAITTADKPDTTASPTLVKDATMLTWITQAESGNRSIRVSLLDEGGADPIDVIKAKEGWMPKAIELTPASTLMAAVGWIDVGETNTGVYLQMLLDDGTPDGTPDRLSAYAHSAGSIDLTTDKWGGAAVYSVAVGGAKHVRFQTFNLNGAKNDERKLTLPPDQGTDASIAYFGGHDYVIVYRALSAHDIDRPMIRLVTVDTGVNWDPNGLDPINVAEAADDGGRTTVKVASDGTLLVTWLDAVSTDEKVLKAVRIH